MTSVSENQLQKRSKDITIFCTGSMVYQSLEASKFLEKENISAKVVNIHTIKPIDKEAILIPANQK